MDSSAGSKIKFLPHHKQQSLCTTRPLYRQGRKLTAVKVYTVNDESVHLLIHGVPSIGLLSEVSMLCERYGRVKSIKLVDQYSTDQEEFTNVYHVQFERIQSARFAKKILDNRSFFGGVLHVCYAPELETINETKLKLVNRKREVAKRSRHSSNETNSRSNDATNNMDEESFKSSYEDKFSLEKILATDPNNSICFPSTSQSTSTSPQLPSFIGPTMPNSSDFNINTQILGPCILPQQMSASNSLTSQDTNKKKQLKTWEAVNRNIPNPRKRPYSGLASDTQPLGSAIVSQQITESQTTQPVKKHKVFKTFNAVDKNFPHPLVQSSSSSTTTPQYLDLNAVTVTSHLESSTTQNVGKKFWAPKTNKIVTSDSNAATSDNSLNPLKKPIVGPMRFIPRSLTIKKKPT